MNVSNGEKLANLMFLGSFCTFSSQNEAVSYTVSMNERCVTLLGKKTMVLVLLRLTVVSYY